MAFSCEMAGGLSGGEFENPLDECVLPSEVWAGGEGIIQWNGFREGASLVLVSAGQQEYPLDIRQFTPSGISFLVPADVPEGLYDVVLLQDGRKELGQLTVHACKSPVYGVKVPAGASQGETISISGIGFTDGCAVVLVGTDGQEHLLETSLTDTGVAAVVPEDLAEGKYSVHLLQDGMMWLLSSSFDVVADIVIKTLVSVRYHAPYVGTAKLMLEWTVDREEPVGLKVAEYIVEGEETQLQAYDMYVSDASGSFVLEHDGFEMSNDVQMSYVFAEDGVVTGSDVLIYGKSEPTPFVWSYDSDGYLVDISSPKTSFRSFGYQDGNLTLFRNTGFEYEDNGPVNNPYAWNVVWGYMALMEKDDPFVYVPYLMGWYAKTSEQLPVRMLSPDPSGNGTVTCPLSYEFDADGYVTAMTWDDGKDDYRVEYLYL